jgi:hypothetical protein
MDGQQIDQIARALARGISRRSALKVVLGGAAGGALAVLRVKQSTAAVPTECRQCCARFCSSAGQTHRACKPDCINGDVGNCPCLD